MQYAYCADCYFTKTVQVFVMLALCVFISHQMLNKGKKIAWVTVGIASLAIVNGIASIVRV